MKPSIHRVARFATALLIGFPLTALAQNHMQNEKQITNSPKNHNLDNNDNFSVDGRFLCYDTREFLGPGIENSQSVEKVEITTGKETIICEAKNAVTGVQAAPGIGAASYSPIENKVAFIHGPLIEEVPVRGYYGKPNRRGAEVVAEEHGKLTWLDCRDVVTGRETLPGAHRGGTHRHEYSLDGKRIGFTYDDFLLPEYERTIGYIEKHDDAPGDATGYFALLVRVAPSGKSKPGEIERAASDSWVGAKGHMRGFIGKVRNDDGVTYEESLFVVDVPANVDITTADSGSDTRYPSPPKGLTIRRLTHTLCEGIIRGTVAGDRIAYYATVSDGTKQLFIIPSDGSDQSPDPEKRPKQATTLPDGAGACVRWHPSGNSIACLSNDGIVVTCVQPGPKFGKSVFLTPQGDGKDRSQLVWSPDGKLFAYNMSVPTKDANGNVVKTYDGKDCIQIFTIEFPDADGDGIVDGI